MILDIWYINLYNKIIQNNLIKKKNYNLLIRYNTYFKVNKLVLSIVKWMYCKYLKNNQCCDNCINCRLLDKNIHPDYYHINVDKNNVISLNTILKIINHVQQSTLYLGSSKILYFSHTSFLTKYTFNAILKLMEDFPYRLNIIFTCFNYVKIPPTIYSRCLIYQLNTPSENVIFHWILCRIKNCNKLSIVTAIRLSNYSPYVTLFLLEKYWVYRLILFKNIKYILLKNINILMKNINLKLLKYNLYWLVTFFLDVCKYSNLYFSLIKNNLINLDKIHLIKYFNNILPSKIVFLIVHKLISSLQILFKIKFINRKNLFYDILSYIVKCIHSCDLNI